MSAIREEGADNEPINTLVCLFHNHQALDFVGVAEVLGQALYDNNDEDSKAFDLEFVSDEENTLSSSGISFRSHLTYKEAYKRLKEIDVLVVPGGPNFEELIKNNAEPLPLIRAFADLQEHNSARERTILSIDTGSLFLANQGILQGLAATTHPDHYIKLELYAQESAQRDLDTRTEVIEGERYVVNQGRFDVDDTENNPYVFKKVGRKMSTGGPPRKGAEARKMSNARRESIIRRASMRLGGMRVITAGGGTAGIDASLYLVSALVSWDSAQRVGEKMQYKWQKGVVVDSIDV